MTCTLPSSVPTQIRFGFFGDSQIEKIVVCISADELSTVMPPDCFLLLLFGIVGRQIRRDALPGLPVIARAEQKLRADIDRPVLRRADVNRRVPVKAELPSLITAAAAGCCASRASCD